MRVVVRHPDADHPNVAPFAYRMGRITEHTDFLTGETTPANQVAEQLIKLAKQEYPGHDVGLERFRDNGDGTGEWVSAEEPADVPVSTHDVAAPLQVVSETDERV